jgi:tRNA threonylcarbamoyladenosine biosynthesis protein TsaB
MLTLTIRTDRPESEVGLYENENRLKYEVWLAHRELAETIHKKIEELLKSQQKELNELGGIIVFKGPGSFTGLRIGITVANALADSLGIPIVSAKGENWVQTGLQKLQKGENERIVLPEYGSEPNITQPKH